MAIRKDLDDMLNSLNRGPEKKPKPPAPKPEPVHQRKTKFDDMSVDDLLGAISGGKSGGASEIAEKIEEEITKPAPEPAKKKVVITGELPDYEAIRQRELEKDRQEKLRREEEAARIAAEKAAAEKAEAERLAAEKAAAEKAEAERLAAERAAAEKAEAERLAAERAAAEKAEAERLAAEKAAAEKAEAERLAAEKAAAEKAEAERLAAEKAAAEKAEAEETQQDEVPEEAPEEDSDEKRRKSIFSKIKNRLSGEEKKEEAPESAPEEPEEKGSDEVVFTEELIVNETSIDDVFGEEAYAEEQSQLSVDELMEAAIAAVNEEIEHNSAEDLEEAPEEEPAEEELPESPQEDSDPVGSMIENMRSDAASAIADIESPKEEPAEEAVPEEAPAEEAPAEPEEKPVKKGRVTRALENILDEDPAAIMDERTVKTEEGDEPKSSGKAKKVIYAILGVIFAALACVGLITVVTKAMSYWGSFTSGETKRDGFADVIYPAVIMDIESFESPSELTSEQVITAALWSMIMDGKSLDKYQKTFDVVSVPSTDVEAAAVKLFGENIPQLTHTTVGPANSRFYYNDESKAYNVPVKPATYTYSPDIKSVSKTGSEYTVVVDYIDELPAWMERTSSKSVEFKLTETNEGYQISAMKVLSATGSI